MIASYSCISVLHRQLLFQDNASTVRVSVPHFKYVPYHYNALSLMPAPDFCCTTALLCWSVEHKRSSLICWCWSSFAAVLQVCSDGLLLGPGPWGEAQVSAACPVSHRVSRSVGRLRVNKSFFFFLLFFNSNKAGGHYSLGINVGNCALSDERADLRPVILFCTVLWRFYIDDEPFYSIAK